MTYVYDLFLNFNNELYDFYEWKKEDIIVHIKRIHLARISSEIFNTILDYNVIFDDDFLLNIFNRCEYFDNRSVLKIPYAILLSDSYRVLALKLDMHGKIIGMSNLLLDEEEDVLDIVSRLAEIKLDIKKTQKREDNNFLTRQENSILKYIQKDLNTCWKEKNLAKLKYLYYEYFNKECDDLNMIYQDLKNELEMEITHKHYDLYNLIKLSYTHKSV